MIYKTTIFLFILFYSSASFCDVESLSKETRNLLKSEMNLIDAGFNELFTAYYSGDIDSIVKISTKLKNSYILKKSLSLTQKEELHTKLPKEFLALDERFHYYAGMLAHVAEQQKDELVGFYFSELAQSCNECHSKFARHRFSSFKKDVSHVKHKH